ncbi:MAG: DUF3616 domain-containing protein [Bryobacterales bacterium]
MNVDPLATTRNRGNGQRAVRVSLILAYALAAGPLAEAQNPLDRFPVCEPSAAALVPCEEPGGACLLLGDNEEEENLYLYRIRNGETLEPTSANAFGVPLGDEISDIEAIARLGTNEILVFGSHGRDRACGPEGKRRRLLRARYDAGRLEALGEGVVKSKKISCAQLLQGSAAIAEERRGTAGSMAQAVCAAVDTAEKTADEVNERRKENKDRDRAEKECEAASPFNLEGAVAVEHREGSDVWIGLRSPQVKFGSGPPKAVLLRMAALDKFEFNAAALIDLGGRGVRELTESGQWIWGIAGPAQDSDAPFSLWRFPKSNLKPGAIIKPEIVRQLPTSSEGLAVEADKLWVVIDGGRGKEKCTQAPQVMSIPNR